MREGKEEIYGRTNIWGNRLIEKYIYRGNIPIEKHIEKRTYT